MQFTRCSIFEIDAIDAIALVDVGKASSPFLNNRRAPIGFFILLLLHASAWGTRRINLNPEHHKGATLVRWFEGLEAGGCARHSPVEPIEVYVEGKQGDVRSRQGRSRFQVKPITLRG